MTCLYTRLYDRFEVLRDGPLSVGCMCVYITFSDIKASISDKVNAIQGKDFRSVCFEWCLKRKKSV